MENRDGSASRYCRLLSAAETLVNPFPTSPFGIPARLYGVARPRSVHGNVKGRVRRAEEEEHQDEGS